MACALLSSARRINRAFEASKLVGVETPVKSRRTAAYGAAKSERWQSLELQTA